VTIGILTGHTKDLMTPHPRKAFKTVEMNAFFGLEVERKVPNHPKTKITEMSGFIHLDMYFNRTRVLETSNGSWNFPFNF